jgi:hypothetical protein
VGAMRAGGPRPQAEPASKARVDTNSTEHLGLVYL